MAVTIKYNNSVTNLDYGKKATLPCGGKVMSGNIEIENEAPMYFDPETDIEVM